MYIYINSFLILKYFIKVFFLQQSKTIPSHLTKKYMYIVIIDHATKEAGRTKQITQLTSDLFNHDAAPYM